MLDPLPVPPGWRTVVIDTIDRLERRAAQGETFARLALPGWYAELERIEETNDGNDQTLLRRHHSHS